MRKGELVLRKSTQNITFLWEAIMEHRVSQKLLICLRVLWEQAILLSIQPLSLRLCSQCDSVRLLGVPNVTMSNLYPASMKNMPPNPNVPVYIPKMEPQSPEAKHRRREQLKVLKTPISEMLKELWRCKLQQQCDVDSAGEISTWPPGQVR